MDSMAAGWGSRDQAGGALAAAFAACVIIRSGGVVLDYRTHYSAMRERSQRGGPEQIHAPARRPRPE